MSSTSPLKPISPDSLPNYEQEEHAPWIMRKLVGSMVGRVVVSSMETFKATGTNIICLSAWGDSSPLFLPCIMWRDVIIHTVIAATGGTAAIAAPAMGPIMDTVVSTVGDSIAVEMGMRIGYDVGIKAADDLLIEHTIKHAIPIHSSRLETTAAKQMTITSKYKHTRVDALLGYFRSSQHNGDAEQGLFSSVKDYLSIEKGWWNPVLFASGRRPCIPRSMQPDVIFCHGPFLQADYRVAETLLAESASTISFATSVTPPPAPPLANAATKDTVVLASPPSVVTPPATTDTSSTKHTSMGDYIKQGNDYLKTGQETLTDLMHKSLSLTGNRSRPTSPKPPTSSLPVDAPSALPAPVVAKATPHAAPVTPSADEQIMQVPAVAPLRRMVILLVGIAPHRKLWTTSARPSESVIQYTLLNGCPAIVVPVKEGCPLMAWDTMTLEGLWTVPLEGEKFDGVVGVLFEYVGLCCDWERFEFADSVEKAEESEEEKERVKKTKQEVAEELTKNALALLVAATIRSKDSKEAKKYLDKERAGIVMLRMP